MELAARFTGLLLLVLLWLALVALLSIMLSVLLLRIVFLLLCSFRSAILQGGEDVTVRGRCGMLLLVLSDATWWVLKRDMNDIIVWGGIMKRKS